MQLLRSVAICIIDILLSGCVAICVTNIQLSGCVANQPELLHKVVKQLESIKFVTDTLSLGDCKFMVSMGKAQQQHK